MKSNIIMLMMIICSIQIKSQNIYSLEDCRKAALENNKEQKSADEEISIAEYKKKAAFTKYLPDISIKGSYMRNQKEMSLIGEDLFLPIGTVTSEGTFGFRQDQINNKWTMVNGQPLPLDANGQPVNPKNHPENI